MSIGSITPPWSSGPGGAAGPGGGADALALDLAEEPAPPGGFARGLTEADAEELEDPEIVCLRTERVKHCKSLL